MFAIVIILAIILLVGAGMCLILGLSLPSNGIGLTIYKRLGNGKKNKVNPTEAIKMAPNMLVAKVAGIAQRTYIKEETKTLEEQIKLNETIARGLESEIRVYEAQERLTIVQQEELRNKREDLAKLRLEREIIQLKNEIDQIGKLDEPKSRQEERLERLERVERDLQYKRMEEQIKKLHVLKRDFEMSKTIKDFYQKEINFVLKGRNFEELNKVEQEEIEDLQDRCLADLDRL